MRASDVRGLAVAALLLTALGGCASNPAPDGWLPTPDRAATDPYGAWIEVRGSGPAPAGEASEHSWVVEGEFLAVDGDSLIVLEPTGRVVAVPLDRVESGTVAHYDPESGKIGTWTALGIVSTLSHGIALIATMPLWIIVGTISTGGQAASALVRFDRTAQPDALRAYARYPGGRPPDLPAFLPAKPVRRGAPELRPNE